MRSDCLGPVPQCSVEPNELQSSIRVILHLRRFVLAKVVRMWRFPSNGSGIVIAVSGPSIMTSRLPVARASSRCALFGHRVHHSRIAGDGGTPCVRCGSPILYKGNSISHVCHSLSCFFGRHHYVHASTRASHHEYVCERCGHPLLFESGSDPYASQGKFKKRVSYACGLLGHRVHVVATGPKATEYACLCGHSFIKAKRAITVIRHPLACVALGHFVKVNEIRGEWAEYVCCRCGHPFCFKISGFGRIESDLEQRSHG